MDAHWLMTATAVAVPAVLAITMHEAAHGWVASKLGDDTALRLGRVSFNPLRHVDLVGTVLLPAAMYFSTGLAFGWAKPVPVNFMRLRNPRADMVKVALAGPVTNLLLAVLSAVVLHWVPDRGGMAANWLAMALTMSVVVNVVLMVFNMIPLPPLDGGRVAVGLLPDMLALPLARAERFGMFALIGVMFIVPLIGQELGYDINPLVWALGTPIEWIVDTLMRLTGNG